MGILILESNIEILMADFEVWATLLDNLQNLGVAKGEVTKIFPWRYQLEKSINSLIRRGLTKVQAYEKVVKKTHTTIYFILECSVPALN